MIEKDRPQNPPSQACAVGYNNLQLPQWKATMTNRYQKEIEEILKKAGEPPSGQQPSDPVEPPQESRPRRRSRPSPHGGAMRGLAVSYKHLLLAGVGVLVVSIFIGGLPMFLVGAGLLVAGYIWYYRAPRSGGGSSSNSSGGRSPKMWRGRMIDPGDDPHFTNDRWGRRR